MQAGNRVRFTNKSRNGDWSKGDQGEIKEVLAQRPENQIGLYVVELDSGNLVWAVDGDIERFEQMALPLDQ